MSKIRKKTVSEDLNCMELYCEALDGKNGVCGKKNGGPCENSVLCGDGQPITLNVAGCSN
ncbi:MAG: hypothetical protein LBB34_03670 [Holosporales bacterium]|jgi:hypothetical protein|nr:hypothetical protein [Holosporales bacterium]